MVPECWPGTPARDDSSIPLGIDDIHQRVNRLGLKAPQKITSGGGIRNSLCSQNIEVGFVVATQLQVVQGLASGQEVVGEIEDVVGFKVGNVPLEEVELGVEGLGQPETLHEQLHGPQARPVQPFALGGNVIVDVL